MFRILDARGSLTRSYRDPLGEVYICPFNGHLDWYSRPGVISAVVEEREPPPRPAPPFCPEHDLRVIELDEDETRRLTKLALKIETPLMRVFLTQEGSRWRAQIASIEASPPIRKGYGSTPSQALASAISSYA